jgi:hypothetical protein
MNTVKWIQPRFAMVTSTRQIASAKCQRHRRESHASSNEWLMRQCGAGGFRAGRAAEWHAARAAAGRCAELNETNGGWGTAQEIAANLNTGGASRPPGPVAHGTLAAGPGDRE